MNALRWVVSYLVMLSLATTGCTSQKVESSNTVDLVQATSEIPDEQLLDVGIQVFDPGLPEKGEELPRGVFPDVRESEARYMPIYLKSTMQDTGHWGAVRVVPEGSASVDVTVMGQILNSNGKRLSLQVWAVDAAGRLWLDRKYKQVADPLSYLDEEDGVAPREPYQYLYNTISNDLLEARNQLKPGELQELRELSRMKFAADLAPTVYTDYIGRDRKGRYTVERLPSDDDPMNDRVARIREREYMFVDTLNEHYAAFYDQMVDPYDNWRRFSYDEQTALDEIRKKARMQKIIGAIALVGAMFAEVDSGTEAAIRDAAAIGGAMALQAGMATSQEAKLHVEALKELGASFEAEVEPLVIEVEGHTLRLSGSVETQYEEWRRLLREIYATETGLPVDPNEAEAAAATTPSEG